MLTALLAGVYALKQFFMTYSWRWFRIPPYAFPAFGGAVLALLIVYGLPSMPPPTVALNLDKIIEFEPYTSHKISFNAVESRPLEYKIPPELYPSIHYPAPEPLRIASSSLYTQTWGSQKTENIIQPLNNSEGEKPKLAEKTQTPLIKGVYHKLQEGENLWVLAKAYGVSFNKITYYNQDLNPRRMRPGDKVFIPGAEDPLPPKSNTMILPLAHMKYISSRYGYRTHPLGGHVRFHKGVDMSASSGTAVRAVLDGVVTYSGRKGQLGNTVEIKHDNGLKTVYGHNRRLKVRAGQRVRQGTIIAEVGNTGRSSAPHLHFEVWKGNKHKNPVDYLPNNLDYKYDRVAKN